MSEIYTLSDLLNNWRAQRIALMMMTRQNYGDDSPEQNKFAYVMYLQLTSCIEELDALINKSPLNRAMIKVTEAENVSDAG